MGVGNQFKTFPFFKQFDAMDCGPTCLRMVAQYHGRSYSLQSLREKCYLSREGVSLKGISEGAEQIGFNTLVVKIPFKDKTPRPCLKNAPLPAIAYWNQNHFVVVTKVSNKHVWIADPAAGILKLRHEVFQNHWKQDQDKGFVLLLEPGKDYFDHSGIKEEKKGWTFLYNYLKPYKKLFWQLILGLVVSSIFTVLFPFLTQAVVDVGIQNQDIGFINLILIGQLILFFSQTLVRFIQNWILLHVGVRLNVSLISDFLVKIMKLPLGFFDSKMTGDLLQRINDHKRIEGFLTQSTLSIIFSIFNLVIFSAVLLYYSTTIFLIFFIAALLYIGWITLFLKKRRTIDYQSFQQLSDNQDSLIEIIHGMPEIKLQGSQLKRRWQWAEIQARLFQVKISALALSQYQDGGAMFINQFKDILITVLAAKSVVDGEITLGMMLSIQYIIGQVNAPLQQLIGFIRKAQDAQISLDRLQEVHQESNEEQQIVSNLMLFR
jgi:ATP-binding cassette subfamily B protein